MSNSDRWVVVLHGYDWIVEAEDKEDDENYIADCGAGDEAEAIAKSIVADHNGCIGIDEPETTVPELVDVIQKCRDAIKAMFDGPPGPVSAGTSCNPGTMEWTYLHFTWQLADDILAKTGKHEPD